MADPSDRYTWRDFVLDLQKRGCEAVTFAGALTIERKTPDGRTLRAPITGLRAEDLSDLLD